MASKWVLLTDKERTEILSQGITPSLRKKLEKVDKRIAISSAKAKGMGLQRKACEDIAEVTGIEYKQGDDNSLIESRGGGQHGTDVILRGEARVRFPFSVECKASESLNLVNTIDQASTNMLENTDWLILHKKKALSEPIVVLRWKRFLEIWKKVLDKK